jgi:hypothetical protein
MKAEGAKTGGSASFMLAQLREGREVPPMVRENII